MFRTLDDIKSIQKKIGPNADYRICKGIYLEPEEIAHSTRQPIIDATNQYNNCKDCGCIPPWGNNNCNKSKTSNTKPINNLNIKGKRFFIYAEPEGSWIQFNDDKTWILSNETTSNLSFGKYNINGLKVVLTSHNDSDKIEKNKYNHNNINWNLMSNKKLNLNFDVFQPKVNNEVVLEVIEKDRDFKKTKKIDQIQNASNNYNWTGHRYSFKNKEESDKYMANNPEWKKIMESRRKEKKATKTTKN